MSSPLPPRDPAPRAARPALSICIPTYRRPDLLRETLDHLHEVVGDDVEIVVTDNASPDHTPAVIEAFRARHPRFRTLRHAENVGSMRNFASAMALATGRYLYTLSDDDAIDYAGIQAAVRILDEDPSITAVYGAYQEWNRTTDRIIGTFRSVESREDFAHGDKLTIFNRFTLVWFPVCRTEICQRFFSYDDDTFGMWPLVWTLLEHGNVSVIPDIFYKHAHTEPRMEFELTENWYHDAHRAQYEVYVGRTGEANPGELARFINTRVGPAYLQGLRFAEVKGNFLKGRHFLLRARAYGFIDEPSVRQWERANMPRMVAEKLLAYVRLQPEVREVLFELDPRLDHVKARFSEIAATYQVGSIAPYDLDGAPLREDQFVLTRAYLGGPPRAVSDPSRCRAFDDLVEGCRLTPQPL